MRVTQGMISNNTLRNLSNSYSTLNKYMDQLATGKKINKPSDDPVIAMKGMDYRSQVTEVEQYKRNTNEVHNWMDNSDSALDKATQALQRMRELAVQGSNGTYEGGQRKNIKEEVLQLKEHIINIANTKVNDKYIFNGTKTDEKPIKEPITYDGAGNANVFDQTGGPVMIEVSDNIYLQANVDGSEVFGSELIKNIDNFIDGLDTNNQTKIEESIGSIDESIHSVINTRANLGARMNRLDLVENRLGSQEISAKRMMSKNEDIDFEKVITNLTSQESVHRAALSAGSRIIQPSLLDFLR